MRQTKPCDRKLCERWRNASWRLREEMRAPARDPSPNPQLPGQSMVAKALYDIPRLNEKEFDVWLSFVSDAMLGAGMGALFRASAFPNDNGVDAVDLVEISTYPTWLTNGAWTALRRSVGADATAYARSMAIKPGDVLALLGSLGLLRTTSGPPADPVAERLDQDKHF